MKKEIIIVVVILFVIIILNIITQKYTNTHMGELKTKLTEVKTEISNQDKEKSTQKIEEAFNYWNEVKETFVIYLEHAELEKVEMYMEEAKTNIQTGEWNVAVSAIDTSTYMLNQIKERYQFSLKNIF